jgi:hypothetical protein
MINTDEIKKSLEQATQNNQETKIQDIQERLILTEAENKAKENFEKSVKTLEGNETEKLREKFKELDNATEVLVKSNINGLISIGTGGIGKSYKILKKLTELKVDFIYQTAFSTPLELYHTLYEHNGKVIVIDDCEGILNNIKCVSILKNALWSVTGTRILNYKSTSELLKAPKQFEFTGKLIIITNRLTNETNLKALVSRVLFCDLKFSYYQILEMMEQITINDYKGLQKEEREKVFNYIKRHSSPCVLDFNLRILIKAFEIYKIMNNWKDIVKDMLKEDTTLKVVYNLEKEKTRSVKDRIQEFARITGMSRATYFNYKRKI